MKASTDMKTAIQKVNDQLPYLVSYVDKNLVYQYVNERYTNWFGKPSEEIIGKSVKTLIGDIAYQSVEHYLKEALSGVTTRYETKMPYTNRTPIFVRGTLIPDKDQNGDVIGITATIEDFTELESSYNKLATLDKAKTEFLKIISHELNTPLNGIIGFSSLLKENLEGSDDEYLAEQVVNSANRLLKLTQTALLITQLNSKTYQIKADPGNLAEFVRNIVLADKSVNSDLFIVEVDLPEKLPQVCFETDLIMQSIKHLISNSRKHTDTNTRLAIGVEEAENEIVLTFNDNGPGFTQEYLNYLFGFFASFDSSKVADERYGLGLAFINLVMEAHDGKVSLMNNMDGGACVKLHFKKYQCPGSMS